MLEAHLWSDSSPQNDADPREAASPPQPHVVAAGESAPLPSQEIAAEDSATLFIPPELYERLMVTPRRPASSAEHTLASARDLPSAAAAQDTPGDGDAASYPAAVHSDARFAMAAAPTEPKVTANGTMLMHAMPYLVGQFQPAAPPAPPPPPSAPDAAAAAPESARVRRALDEMSMVIDIQSMSRKLASASEDELARYVDVLRRSEGLPEAAAAGISAPQLPSQQQGPIQGQPPYGYAPHAHYPQQSYAPAQQAAPAYGPSGSQPAAWTPPPAAWAPPPGSAAPPPWVHPSQPLAQPAPLDTASSKPAKRAGVATAMFAVMFIVTLLGVGAVTYVALRGGDLAANGAAAAQRAPL
jgi:hypothetical protein